MIDEATGDDAAPEEAVEAPEPAAEIRSGNDVVDDVLASLEALPELPLDDHVAVFERAHEQLRGALDGPREP